MSKYEFQIEEQNENLREQVAELQMQLETDYWHHAAMTNLRHALDAEAENRQLKKELEKAKKRLAEIENAKERIVHKRKEKLLNGISRV